MKLIELRIKNFGCIDECGINVKIDYNGSVVKTKI